MKLHLLLALFVLSTWITSTWAQDCPKSLPSPKEQVEADLRPLVFEIELNSRAIEFESLDELHDGDQVGACSVHSDEGLKKDKRIKGEVYFSSKKIKGKKYFTATFPEKNLEISCLNFSFKDFLKEGGKKFKFKSLSKKVSKKSILVPFFLAQTLGYQGLVAIGVGSDITPWISLRALMGYTPASMVGNKNGLLQYTGALEIHPFGSAHIGIPLSSDLKLKIDPLFLGGAITYTPDHRTFSALPKQYEAGYYAPTSYKPLVLLGASLGLEVKDKEVAKLSTGPVYLLKEEIFPVVKNFKYIEWGDIPKLGSWQVSLTLFLDPKSEGKKDKKKKSKK